MGSADIIPGVSGGTVAFITGIYEHFIAALKSINFRFVYYGFRGIFQKKYRIKATESLERIDWQFLVPLALGIFVAFLVFANIVGFFLESYPTYTFAFFFGLILSSAVLIGLLHRDIFVVTSVIFLILGCLAGYFITGLQAIQVDHSYLIIFVSGIVTFCAMILPGLSGAFILLVLGQYEFMLDVLQGLTHLQLWNLTFAFVYVLGGIVGLILFSRMLSHLLTRHRKQTLCFVLGLMIGALRLPLGYIASDSENLMLIILSACLGVSIVAVFGIFDRQQRKHIISES